MKLNRREFIISAAAVAVLPTPAIVSAAPVRAPFLRVRQTCDFLYFEDWQRPYQPETISALVEHVGEWNGEAYPVVLAERHHGVNYWDGIDSEWCLFREEVPEFSWKDHEGRYPNIHAYVREKRFGEDPRVMWERMEHNRLHGRPADVTGRQRLPTRKTLFPSNISENGEGQ